MGVNLPTFFGFFNAQRGLQAHQIALQVVNNNIANVNTPGYSRQRVDLSAASAFTNPGISTNVNSPLLGQGVNVDALTRSHDQFIDTQIRSHSSLEYYNQVARDALQQLQGYLQEPSGEGVNDAMQRFFSAAQSLGNHPEDMGVRTNFVQAAKSLLTTVQQQIRQISDLRTGIISDPNNPATLSSSRVAYSVDDINQKLQQLTEINQQIVRTSASASGVPPSNLLDARDKLLEELSQKINITVDYQDNYYVDVRLGSNYLTRGATLTDTLQVVQNPGPVPDPNDSPVQIQLASTGTDITSDVTGGELGGYLFIGGTTAGETTLRSVLQDLNTLFTQVATEVNTLHSTGRDRYGNLPDNSTTPPNDEFFYLDPLGTSTYSALDYSINSNILSDPGLFAAAKDDPVSGFLGVGDGRNAQSIAQLADSVIAGLGNIKPSQFFLNTLTEVGVATREATDNADNLASIASQLDERRQSVQGVSLEDEMLDMLRFQRGFEASARMLNTLDGVMDTIINKLI